MRTALHRIGATVLVVVGVAGALSGVGGAEDDTAAAETTLVDERPRLSTEPAAIVAAAAEAMGSVRSIRFTVERTGAPVYIDPVESLALDRVVGRFAAPADADAIVTVTVEDSLVTRLGAVALGAEVWLSNPVTGVFEPLPAGYDIDPSRFFEPTDGWQPLLEELRDPVLVGAADGDDYQVRGVARGVDIRRVTSGLVRADEVPLDLWVDARTALVHRVEFSVEDRHGVSDWTVVLTEHDRPVTIDLPDGVSR